MLDQLNQKIQISNFRRKEQHLLCKHRLYFFRNRDVSAYKAFIRHRYHTTGKSHTGLEQVMTQSSGETKNFSLINIYWLMLSTEVKVNESLVIYILLLDLTQFIKLQCFKKFPATAEFNLLAKTNFDFHLSLGNVNFGL